MQYAPYSFSKITLYERCPYAWYLQYVKGLKPPPSPEMELGTVAHCIMETYLQELLSYGEVPELKRIIEEFSFLEGKNFSEFSFPEISLPRVTAWGVEEFIGLSVNAREVKPDSSKTFLRGKIDFWYIPLEAKTPIITDWKTSVWHVDERQVALYAILLAFRFPEADQFEVRFVGLKDGKEISKTVHRKELKSVWAWVCDMVDKIETEKQWDPTPGPHCKWCGYLEMGLCPIQKDIPTPKKEETGEIEIPEIPKIETPKTAEEAVKLAAFLKVVEEIKERCRKALRPWVEQNGPVELNGTRFGLWESSYITWKTSEAKQKVAQTLLEADIPRERVWEIFNVDRKKLASLLKKEEKQFLLEELESLGEQATYSRLDWKS